MNLAKVAQIIKSWNQFLQSRRWIELSVQFIKMALNHIFDANYLILLTELLDEVIDSNSGEFQRY